MTAIRVLLVSLVVGALCTAAMRTSEATEPAVAPVEVHTEPAAVCCSGDVCVEWSGSTCSGELGWCDASTDTSETGITVAACEVAP